jgi:hypothetical protein
MPTSRLLVLTLAITGCRTPLEPWQLPRTALPDVVSLAPDIEYRYRSLEGSSVDESRVNADGTLGYRASTLSASDPRAAYYTHRFGQATPLVWSRESVLVGDVDLDGREEYFTDNGAVGELSETSRADDYAPGGEPAVWLVGVHNRLVLPLACGDVNGDGNADLCSDRSVDYGPFDGALDFEATSFLLGSGRDAGGRIADVDGDGAFEYYIIEGEEEGTGIRTLDDTWSFEPEGTLNRTVRPHNPHRTPGVLYMTGRLGPAKALWRLTADHLTNNEPPDVLPLDGNVLAIGDFRGDGTHQVITSRGNRLIAREIDGTPIAWFEPVFPDLQSPDRLDFGEALAVGDHDGDGVDDLVVESHAYDWLERSYVQVYFAPLAGL